ncbi:hypothetical protein HY641_03015 [Candidatus Woesearchaeota archaeon]|nr:hypothetical protein [Candidatus Woesearchaeota archaeon]
MNTTIAVKQDTLDMLKHVKDELRAETLDATIKQLVLLMKQPKKSMFGSLRGIRTTFKREKHDRFD